MKRNCKNRQSSGFLKGSKGRYLRKQASGEKQFKTKSNQQVFIGHLVPHVSGKLTKKVQHFSDYMGTQSKYYQKQKKKNMRPPYHKKLPLNSQIFLDQSDNQNKNDFQHKNKNQFYKDDPITKQVSKETSLSKASQQKFKYHQVIDDGPQQMHFTMVKAQQQYKNVINN